MSERWLPKSKFDLVVGVWTGKSWVECRSPRGLLPQSLRDEALDLIKKMYAEGKGEPDADAD